MTLPPLAPGEFAAIFEEVHGVQPFPWQARLAERLATGGGWPGALGLPTGSGKTAVIDIAVFHLALQVSEGAARQAPVRIAFVVDRRIIVDAAAERAARLAEALSQAEPTTPLGRMASRLSHLAGPGAPPLSVATLRGGLPREAEWARSPAQATVLCSTVDQIGSRLLFRGYGVSDRMKPVHAGLIGSDCLILLDEAHLSAPFAETLARVERYRRPPWCEAEPGPWGVVSLSATPGGAAPEFGLDAADRAHPVLRTRLETPKRAELVALPVAARDERRSDPIADHADAFATQATALLQAPDVRRLAVVVNRVALARGVFERLARSLDGRATVELLTGRVREAEREAVVARLAPRLLSGAPIPSDEPPLVVVATQTIEAGADFDFDGLVTQIAPLDSLRQRFGRLNRMGRAIQARAAILAARDEVSARAEDPVYGDRARRSWAWLQGIAEARGRSAPMIDLGIAALDVRLEGVELVELVAPRATAPVLRPADLLLLSWTAPIPAVDPDIAPFLHGPQAGPADVQIVWRADITRADLDAQAEHLAALLDFAPPHAREVLAVPLWAARAWLQGQDAAAAEAPDVEGAPAPDARLEGGRPVFRWAGPEAQATRVIAPSELRPGDMLVVPADYGGCDAYGWNPASRLPVTDLGDALSPGTRRLRIRLHPGLQGGADGAHRIEALLRADDRSPRQVLEDALDLADPQLVGERDGWSLHRIEGYAGCVLRKLRPEATSLPEAATEDDAAPVSGGGTVTLGRHSSAVEAQARALATAAGLPPSVVGDVAIAAALHDIGKADRRFQLLLHGGDRLAALAAPAPLAKSLRDMDRSERLAAARAAGLPERWRHEARSVAMACGDPRLRQSADPALVLWLVGTHHGHGRPFFPHHDPREPTGQPGPQRLDFMFEGEDWPQIYERLKARHGLWELARLEAVLRLADHRASAEGAS